MDNFMILFMVSHTAVGAVFVAVLAGFIDSIAGGGGLLISQAGDAGMSPANALAGNKLRACGVLSSSLYFIRRRW